MADERLELDEALGRLYGTVPRSVRISRLKGDASTRSYYRLAVDDPSPADDPAGPPRSLIVMRLPEDALGSDEAGGEGRAPAELPFLDVGRLLARRGVPVPEVYAEDLPRRIVLLEDLGDLTLESCLAGTDRAGWSEIYGPAVDLLARMHESCDRPEPGCIAYQRGFDEKLLGWELDHFRQWGLEAIRSPLEEADRIAIDRCFSLLLRDLQRIPTGFVHRDYQSRNLMWAPRRSGEALVVIDFQDALQGPRPYDLVALLCDSYIEIDLDLQQEMMARYLSARWPGRGDTGDFIRAFWAVAVHRKLKDAGRFVYIDRVRGNPGFLPYYSRSLRYVGRALDRLGGLAGLDELLRRLVPGFPDSVPQPESASGTGACSRETAG